MAMILGPECGKRVKDGDETLSRLEELVCLATDTAKRLAETTGNICSAQVPQPIEKDKKQSSRIRSPYFETLSQKVETIYQNLLSMNETMDRFEV